MQECFAFGIVAYKAGICYEIFDAKQKRDGIVFRQVGFDRALDDFFLCAQESKPNLGQPRQYEAFSNASQRNDAR